MLVDEPNFVPYPPGNKTVAVVQRIHAGTAPTSLTEKALVSLGVAPGNANRLQRGLRFLGLIDEEFQQTELAITLRKATSEEYKPLLAQIIKAAYEPIFVAYDPATATGLDLDNAFKPYDPAGQRANMISCFMSLCREADLAPEAAQPRRGRPSKATAPKRPASNPNGRQQPPAIVKPIVPQSTRGTSKTIPLRSGSGEVTLIVTVDLMELDTEDRNFVFRMIDQLRAYEIESPALQRPAPDSETSRYPVERG
jgi:hypothetical protein